MAEDATTTVNRPTVNFLRDVGPYYLPCYVFVVSHLIYQFSGNLVWPIFLAFLFNFPLLGLTYGTAEFNLDAKSEAVFKEDRRFLGPLYAFLLCDYLTWLWCFFVVSGTQVSFLPAWLFEAKLTTPGGWCLFTFVWGYMAGVCGLAGHELIHKREPIHKIMGTYTFSKISYSHFLLEHNTGHHRHVATKEDPATARKGEWFPCFLVRSVVGSHWHTWQRECNRITMKYDEFKALEGAKSLRMVTENRMTYFAAIHLALLFGIYVCFGWAGVLF